MDPILTYDQVVCDRPGLVAKYCHLDISKVPENFTLPIQVPSKVPSDLVEKVNSRIAKHLGIFGTRYGYLLRNGNFYMRRQVSNASNLPFKGVGIINLTEFACTVLLDRTSMGVLIDNLNDTHVVFDIGTGERKTFKLNNLSESMVRSILLKIKEPHAVFDTNRDMTAFQQFLQSILDVQISGTFVNEDLITFVILQNFVRIMMEFLSNFSDTDENHLTFLTDVSYDIPEPDDPDLMLKLVDITKRYYTWTIYVQYLNTLAISSEATFKLSDGGISLSTKMFEDMLTQIERSVVSPFLDLATFYAKIESRQSEIQDLLFYDLLRGVYDTPKYKPLHFLITQSLITKHKSDNLSKDQLDLVYERLSKRAGSLVDLLSEVVAKLYMSAETINKWNMKLYSAFFNGTDRIFRIEFYDYHVKTADIISFNGTPAAKTFRNFNLETLNVNTIGADGNVLTAANDPEMSGAQNGILQFDVPPRIFMSKGVNCEVDKYGVIICDNSCDHDAIPRIRRIMRNIGSKFRVEYNPVSGEHDIIIESDLYTIKPPSEGKDVLSFGSTNGRRSSGSHMYLPVKLDLSNNQADISDLLLAFPGHVIAGASDDQLAALYSNRITNMVGFDNIIKDHYCCRIKMNEIDSANLSWLMYSADKSVRSIATHHLRFWNLPSGVKSLDDISYYLPSFTRLDKRYEFTFNLNARHVAPHVVEFIRRSAKPMTVAIDKDGVYTLTLMKGKNDSNYIAKFSLLPRFDFKFGNRKAYRVSSLKGERYSGLSYENNRLSSIIASDKHAVLTRSKQLVKWSDCFSSILEPAKDKKENAYNILCIALTNCLYLLNDFSDQSLLGISYPFKKDDLMAELHAASKIISLLAEFWLGRFNESSLLPVGDQSTAALISDVTEYNDLLSSVIDKFKLTDKNAKDAYSDLYRKTLALFIKVTGLSIDGDNFINYFGFTYVSQEVTALSMYFKQNIVPFKAPTVIDGADLERFSGHIDQKALRFMETFIGDFVNKHTYKAMSVIND